MAAFTLIDTLQPKGALVLTFGDFTGRVTGGPFAYAERLPSDVLTVKLAQEIKAECDIDLPIRDFSVPNATMTGLALRSVLYALQDGRSVYVGCMAGQGRTGLFLALLTKVAMDYARTVEHDAHAFGGQTNPVDYVRAHYYPHAVETEGQKAFVNDFDTAELVAYVKVLQTPAPVLSPWARFAQAAFNLARACVAAARAVVSGRLPDDGTPRA